MAALEARVGEVDNGYDKMVALKAEFQGDGHSQEHLNANGKLLQE